MIILESGIQITFPDNAKIVKFDETEFYRKSFNPLPRAKGVDVIVDESDHIVFLEIKNCTARESENRWRIGHDDTKRNTVPNGLDISGRNSFDIEMAEKVAMTLACLVGAYTYEENSDDHLPL